MSEEVKSSVGVKNFYPEVPEVPYKRTSVTMNEVNAYLGELHFVAEVKRSAYIMFRNESANGLSGVNNNYIGAQADNNRWPEKWDKSIVATCVKKENMTGKERRFVCFNKWGTSIDFLIDRVIVRGLYVGGFAQRIAQMKIIDPADLARAYYKEWVQGDKKAEPSHEFINDFLSMYKQAARLFV